MALILDGTDGVNQGNVTGASIMPVGTTAQRPASPVEGMFRLNTTTTEPEWYDELSGEWVPFSNAPLRVEYLVIAGGGSGAGIQAFTAYGSAGGGAGGYRSSITSESSGGGAAAEPSVALATNTAHTVTIGAGAATSSIQGSNSVFSTITSIGGGGGRTTVTGGSGGGGDGFGAGGLGTAGQGFAGVTIPSGSSGGGGGGAGSAATTSAGGAGVNSSVTGSAVIRASGGTAGLNTSATPGGGGAGGNNSNGGAGSANTGGGGGGGASVNSISRSGGAGGSGVVIVKYPDNHTITNPGGGLTFSTASAGGFKVTTFTAGTGNIQFN